MKYSGLFFIPNPGNNPEISMQWVTTLITSIESQFKFASRQNSWNIHHRLLRSHNPPPTKTYDDDDGPSTEPPPPPPTSYQHLLHVSYLSQQRTWCYIHTPPPEQPSNHGPANPDAIISIPQPQIESHFQLLVNTWAPLWQFRSILNIPQGHTFSAGQFTIRFGDIRSARQGTQAAIIPSPGVVVCITTTIGAPEDDGSPHNAARNDSPNGGEAAQDEELDFEEARNVIRALWRNLKTGRDFGKSEPREVFMGKDGFEGKGNLEKQYEAHVRMWCEIMRMRGLSWAFPSPSVSDFDIEEFLSQSEEFVTDGEESSFEGKEELSDGEESSIKVKEELSDGEESSIKVKEELSDGEESSIKVKEELSDNEEHFSPDHIRIPW